VVLVNKSTGEKRLCVDFRKLNKQTVAVLNPRPEFERMIQDLSIERIFTTLDILHLTEVAKDKIAFVTEVGTG